MNSLRATRHSDGAEGQWWGRTLHSTMTASNSLALGPGRQLLGFPNGYRLQGLNTFTTGGRVVLGLLVSLPQLFFAPN